MFTIQTTLRPLASSSVKLLGSSPPAAPQSSSSSINNSQHQFSTTPVLHRDGDQKRFFGTSESSENFQLPLAKKKHIIRHHGFRRDLLQEVTFSETLQFDLAMGKPMDASTISEAKIREQEKASRVLLDPNVTPDTQMYGTSGGQPVYGSGRYYLAKPTSSPETGEPLSKKENKHRHFYPVVLAERAVKTVLRENLILDHRLLHLREHFFQVYNPLLSSFEQENSSSSSTLKLRTIVEVSDIVSQHHDFSEILFDVITRDEHDNIHSFNQLVYAIRGSTKLTDKQFFTRRATLPFPYLFEDNWFTAPGTVLKIARGDDLTFKRLTAQTEKEWNISQVRPRKTSIPHPLHAISRVQNHLLETYNVDPESIRAVKVRLPWPGSIKHVDDNEDLAIGSTSYEVVAEKRPLEGLIYFRVFKNYQPVIRLGLISYCPPEKDCKEKQREAHYAFQAAPYVI